MALFGEKVLFSQVSGTVVLNGQPVSGATVKRTAATPNAQPVADSTSTGGDGTFSFPVATASKGLSDLLPSEFAVSQEIVISHNGTDYRGWVYTKRDSAANSESGGAPFRLICDLAREPDFEDKYYGVCRLVR